MAKLYPTIAACDLGSSKIAILLCEITPAGLEVIGFGQSLSQGIRKGSVVNIDAASDCILEAAQEAKNLSQREIDLLVVGVSGGHVSIISSHGMQPVREKEIRQVDVDRVLEAASAVSIPLDREVIQILPQEFILDGQDGVHQPVGMYGRRLEAHIQLVTGSVTSLQNLRRCLSKASLKPQQFILNSLASARAVLRSEEKAAGVCLIDIGAASTDIVVFQDQMLRLAKSLSIGGLHLTNDLAVGLKVALAEAESIKLNFGSVGLADYDDQEEIEISAFSGLEKRRVSKSLLRTIIQPRIEEILQMVRDELAKEGLDESLPTGVVITGGGAALKGILEVVQRVFRLPARLGKPERLGGLSEMISSPAYSTLVGLIQAGFEQNEDLGFYSSLHHKSGFKKVQAQFTHWIKDFF